MADEMNQETDSPQEGIDPTEVVETPISSESNGAVHGKDDVDALRREAQANLEGWQRSRAEFLNYKKRTDREIKESRDKAGLDALAKVLPIIDDFERAVQNIPDDLKANSWVSGTALIMRKFDRLLEEFAVQRIDPTGELFDPRFHEAIGTDASTDDIPGGHVTATLQKGYVSGDRVLRPALVRVAG
jgi:molecular chaperone GrpE